MYNNLQCCTGSVLVYMLIFFSFSFGYYSHLAQNPFICDCNLKWLADYLRANPIETSGARCASPRRLANKRIGQIKSKKFRCSGEPLLSFTHSCQSCSLSCTFSPSSWSLYHAFHGGAIIAKLKQSTKLSLTANQLINTLFASEENKSTQSMEEVVVDGDLYKGDSCLCFSSNHSRFYLHNNTKCFWFQTLIFSSVEFKALSFIPKLVCKHKFLLPSFWP